MNNIVFCLEHETQVGWLIDPDDRTVFVYYCDRIMVETILRISSLAQKLEIKDIWQDVRDKTPVSDIPRW